MTPNNPPDPWRGVAVGAMTALLAGAAVLVAYNTYLVEERTYLLDERTYLLEEKIWEWDLRQPRLIYRHSTTAEPQTDEIRERIETYQVEHQVTLLEALRSVATESYEGELETTVVYASEIALENLGFTAATKVQVMAELKNTITGWEPMCGAESMELLEGGVGFDYILTRVDRLPTEIPCSVSVIVEPELSVYLNPRWIGPEEQLFDPENWTITVIDEYDPIKRIVVSADGDIKGNPFGEGGG